MRQSRDEKNLYLQKHSQPTISSGTDTPKPVHPGTKYLVVGPISGAGSVGTSAFVPVSPTFRKMKIYMTAKSNFPFKSKPLVDGTYRAYFLFTRAGRLKQMVFPTMSALVLSTLIAAILLAVDWYVWGLTYTNQQYRQPVRPSGETSEGKPSAAASEDEAHGFKNVA